MEQGPDAELVARAREGDRRAFDRLVTRYEATARRVASSMVADEEIVRDLVQEAMLQAYLSLAHLRDPERFRSWLYGIVLNVCRSYLRDRKPEPLSLDAETGGSRLDAALVSTAAPDPHALAEARELHRAVLAAVKALPPKDREATLLFYCEQWSLREVAAAAGVSVVAVKDRLHRARRQLRERLLPAYPEMGHATQNRRKRKPMIKARIEGIYEHEKGSFVILQDGAASHAIPIWIGEHEARAIRIGLEGSACPRPLAFDLFVHALQALDAHLEEVRIEALRENTYFAVVKLRRGKKMHEMDARPSDALALAVRMDCPIYIMEEVLEEAKVDQEWLRQRREAEQEG